MCGICGRLNFTARPVERSLIDAMTEVMAHRGPDDAGQYLDERVGLGHRRLSILDLSERGRQPMTTEDEQVTIIFNGEIYNYTELRQELRGKGYRFRSETDTEVILCAYQEYGEAFPEKLDGMFAIALWDRRQKRLLLVRDRLGIKPLYYYTNGDFITFGSEIKAILCDPEVPANVDIQAVSNFLTLHYVPAPRTMFKDIVKLTPGALMTVHCDGEMGTREYWELARDAGRAESLARLDERQLAEHVYSELRESVRKRMQSDVPLGTLVSGGLDSSAILGIMTELSGAPVQSFTVGYSDAGDDKISEFKYSRKVASYFDSEYKEVVVDAKLFLDFLPKAIWHQDEPLGEPASIPLFFVSRLAKQSGVTVLLTGEGSDELFAGYNRHWGEILSRYYRAIPDAVRRRLIGPAIQTLPRAPLLKKGHRAMSAKEFADRYMSWHTVVTEDVKAELLTAPDYLRNTFDDVFQGYTAKLGGLTNLEKILLLDLKVWLPDDLLMKKDKMCMATSIEARVPFLDYRFVELACHISPHHKVRGLTTKYILKRAMEGKLPREIIHRKKEGFPTPIGEWIRGDMQEFTNELLCSDGSLSHGILSRKRVRAIVDAHMSGKEDNSRQIFPLLNFELWHRLFLEDRGSSLRGVEAMSSCG